MKDGNCLSGAGKTGSPILDLQEDPCLVLHRKMNSNGSWIKYQNLWPWSHELGKGEHCGDLKNIGVDTGFLAKKKNKSEQNTHTQTKPTEAQEMKGKIDKWDKILFLNCKENPHECEQSTNQVGENICMLCY